VRTETVAGTTDPTMEQGLEAPALTEKTTRQAVEESERERKGEKARYAVNASAGDGRGGDAGPR
jgi:hypothetical protein